MEYLAKCIGLAEEGDPSSARRAAELFELAGFDTEAAAWWRRAAELGDPDAIDYVEGILHGDQSPSTGSYPPDGGNGLTNAGQRSPISADFHNRV
jgi:hypothetical protein